MKAINEDFKLLTEIVGPNLALKIVEVFAGSLIYIPKNILTARKHLEILGDYKAGKSYRELSLKSGYSESYIRNIIYIYQKDNAHTDQLSLFQTEFDNNDLQEGGS